MSTTGITTSNDLAVKQWQAKTFKQYLDRLILRPYMGADEAAIIQVNEDLSKEKGDKIVFNLLGSLSGSGVTGDSTLEGSEEALSAYAQTVTLEQYRHAIRLTGKLSNQRYPFEMKDKARPALSDWMAQLFEDKCFDALEAIDGVAYGSASEAQKDTWLLNNADRVLFGAAVANNAASDHSVCLAEIDGTADILIPAQITLAKRMAKLCSPKIRPIRLGDQSGMEVYVLIAHPYCTRDLKASTAWQDANREAMARGNDNPIFSGAIGMYDGVIIVESDKIPYLVNVGNGGTVEVAHNFLLGAQALLLAQGGSEGMQQNYVEKEFDYSNQVGVALGSMWKVEKARFATGAAGVSKDHGVMHVYSAAMAD